VNPESEWVQSARQRDPSSALRPPPAVNGPRSVTHHPNISDNGGDDARVPRHRQRRQRHLCGRFPLILKNWQIARPQDLSPAINRKRAEIGRADGVQFRRRLIGRGTRVNRDDGLRPGHGRIGEDRFLSSRHSLKVRLQIISAPMDVPVAFIRRIILHQDALPRLGKGEFRVRRRHDIVPFTPEPSGQAGIADRFASAAAEATDCRQQFHHSRFHEKPQVRKADGSFPLLRCGVNQKSGVRLKPLKTASVTEWLRGRSGAGRSRRWSRCRVGCRKRRGW